MKGIPENISTRALEMRESGKFKGKTAICEAIKEELDFVLTRCQLSDIVVKEDNRKSGLLYKAA